MSDTLDTEGQAAPPRANGELVFTAPWQSRLFGVTMKLREQDRLDWDQFRDGLIAQIANHEAAISAVEEYDYWGCWQQALEDYLATEGLIDTNALAQTAQNFAVRPAGHDHGHHHH